jgi:hypothetical protein
LASIGPFGLEEICRKLEELIWRQRARDWKITGYEPVNAWSHQYEVLLEVLKHLMHGGTGIGVGLFVPILQDIILEERVALRFEVCFDTCTGKETYRRRLGERLTGDLQENVVVSSGLRKGSPDFQFGPPASNIRTRWPNRGR